MSVPDRWPLGRSRAIRAARAVARHPAVAARAGLRAAASAALTVEESLPRDPSFEAFWSDLWIPGWLDKPQAALLYHLAAHGPGDGDVVEIGSYLGRSAAVLAAALRARGAGRVTAVDPHVGNRGLPGTDSAEASTYPLFLHHLRQYGLDSYVEPIVASSLDAAQGWSRPIRLLYLDGLHTEEAVYADLAAWGPHLQPSGVVVVDDYDHFAGIRAGVWGALADGIVTGGPYRVAATVLVGSLPCDVSRISRSVESVAATRRAASP